ncbi:hypothetical protein PIB30_009150 [Stylosanthes scabra]|uniref:Uncharacterized protein n=1 Tax=Stylosanthes scabra TaxID=79078 RepID=A0ABU6X4M2_9FABA|nr:hypothetical protein [Stylosanthes scabra]
MESAMIRIPSSPPLHLSNNGAKVSTYARSSILFFRNNSNYTLKQNQTSLCDSEFASLLHPVITTRSLSCHANCMPERSSFGPPAPPPNNNGNKGRVLMRGISRVSLVLACVLGMFNLNSNINPMFKEAYACKTSTFGVGGQLAVGTLLETIKAKAITKKPTVPKKGSPDVKELKWYAVSQSIAGNNEKAEKILSDELKKDRGPEEELQLQMATVELLILQGKYENANLLLEKLIATNFGMDQNDKKPKDGEGIIDELIKNENGAAYNFVKTLAAQLLFYRAIVLTMNNQNTEAAKWWEAFGKILSLHKDKNNGNDMSEISNMDFNRLIKG